MVKVHIHLFQCQTLSKTEIKAKDVDIFLNFITFHFWKRRMIAFGKLIKVTFLAVISIV